MLQPSQLQDASVRFAPEIAAVRAFLRSAMIDVAGERAEHAVVQRLQADTGFRRDLTSHVWLLLDRKNVGVSEVLAILVLAAAGLAGGEEIDTADAHALLRFILQARHAFEQAELQARPAAPVPTLRRPVRTPGSSGRRNARYAVVAAVVLVVLCSLLWWTRHRQAQPAIDSAVVPSGNTSNHAQRQASAGETQAALSNPIPTPAVPAAPPQRVRPESASAAPPFPRERTKVTEVRPPARNITSAPVASEPQATASSVVKSAAPAVPPVTPTPRNDSSASAYKAVPGVIKSKTAAAATPVAVPAPQLSKLLDSPRLPAYASDPAFTAEGKHYPRLLRRHPSSFFDPTGQSEQVASLHAPALLAGRAASPGIVPSGVVRPACLGMMAGNLEYSPAPPYPQAAAVAHVQGEVRIQATVDRDGSVTSARVISGPPLLREAALDAVQRWHYRPYSAAGRPIPAGTTAVLDFQLE